MLSIICEINLILTWSANCVITNSTIAWKFATTDTKLYIPGVTLSTQDNAKALKQLNSDFKRQIDWNKYESKVTLERHNQDYLINAIFQGVERLFVFSFEDNAVRTGHTWFSFRK